MISDTLIQNSPWKEFASNTNYAFDPYGETEEKNLTTSTTVGASGKEKSSRSRSSNSNSQQQTTLPMSHSPTSKSQLYYEGANGHGGGGEHRSRSRNHYEMARMTIAATDAHNVVPNGHYDRYERDRSNERGGAYTRSSYAERAYSLPRQQAQQQHHANMQPSGYYTQERRGHRQPPTAASHTTRDEQRNGRHYRDGSRSREDPRLSSSGGADTPDFYFMPSQRKYSGEVVRVYVDYNKDPNN
ncbi:unnamed protein product [Ceratitis capitata]|uniref:(Mediterranean fruit fly) hypothetical protein n=1 Tax=Ceratitis capitata TaxID=7213 RepID=A0A811VBN4_CERCA|nr:unnamed protein product [Ceratitis capitata]